VPIRVLRLTALALLELCLLPMPNADVQSGISKLFLTSWDRKFTGSPNSESNPPLVARHAGQLLAPESPDLGRIDELPSTLIDPVASEIINGVHIRCSDVCVGLQIGLRVEQHLNYAIFGIL
jgi:hypothetical protein